jgi:hypothetical protein
MKILWASCRACDFSEVERIPRLFWMRLLSPLRHYHCRKCQASVLARKERVESRQWTLSTFKNFQAPSPLDGPERSSGGN